MHCRSTKVAVLTMCLAILGGRCYAQSAWLLQTNSGAWEKFASEKAWQSAALELQPLETAVIHQSSTGIAVIHDVQGESGDWRNIDRYIFRKNGSLKKLDRVFASVSQNMKLTEIFERDQYGNLRIVFKSEITLDTGRPVSVEPDNPPLPIILNIRHFEFSQLLGKKWITPCTPPKCDPNATLPQHAR